MCNEADEEGVALHTKWMKTWKWHKYAKTEVQR